MEDKYMSDTPLSQDEIVQLLMPIKTGSSINAAEVLTQGEINQLLAAINADGSQSVMEHFPDFMKRDKNIISNNFQNTQDIVGYYYTANDGSQMAFWECFSDKELKRHKHNFDEYMICIKGECIIYIEGQKYILNNGDELIIPKNKEQWGFFKAGTRTIHAFGGKRI
jgi:mannose-6-phosphate isomerase-like protein (cupin superfamily)